MKRRDTLPALLTLVATHLPMPGFAQRRPGKVARIGYLGSASASSPQIASALAALRAGLREFGYVEGQNIEIEFRWADGNLSRLPELAAELVRLKVDLIMAANSPATVAAKRATANIPIIMISSSDAVASGLVASLAQPGGNVTGSSIMLPELSAKRLELLKEAIPRVTHVAVLSSGSSPTGFEHVHKAMEAAAQLLGLRLRRVNVPTAADLDSAFSLIAAARVDALAPLEVSLTISNARIIASHAARLRLPSIGFSQYAEAGGLMSFGIYRDQSSHRAAYFVDKILKGAKPSDIPVEQPTRFEMVVNLKTAKALGIAIPPTVMLRVDKVIE
jgi:putative ABC transport system substrate-binding protein